MMATPKQISDFDQATKQMVDSFPDFWWSLFKECMDLGFTRAEALELVKAQIGILGNAS